MSVSMMTITPPKNARRYMFLTALDAICSVLCIATQNTMLTSAHTTARTHTRSSSPNSSGASVTEYRMGAMPNSSDTP